MSEYKGWRDAVAKLSNLRIPIGVDTSDTPLDLYAQRMGLEPRELLTMHHRYGFPIEWREGQPWVPGPAALDYFDRSYAAHLNGPETPAGNVYFVSYGDDGPIKIGFAIDVQKRVLTLQTSCPYEIITLGTFPASVRHERDLHIRFATHRLKGEWFKRTPELLSAIAEICEGDADG